MNGNSKILGGYIYTMPYKKPKPTIHQCKTAAKTMNRAAASARSKSSAARTLAMCRWGRKR